MDIKYIGSKLFEKKMQRSSNKHFSIKIKIKPSHFEAYFLTSMNISLQLTSRGSFF